MNDKLNKIFTVVMFSILICILGLGAYQYYIEEPITYEDFCLEWERGLTRELLVYQCYNFLEQKIECDWYIQPDHMLILHEYGSSEIIGDYQCVRFIRTRMPEIKFDPDEEIQAIDRR